jgi:ABC-type multidrug transport system fused ATPase/permease subunit
MSIAENIAYGDNTRENIPIEEIIEASKKANIHDFITKLPLVSYHSCYHNRLFFLLSKIKLKKGIFNKRGC